jgi:hypothetical protein
MRGRLTKSLMSEAVREPATSSLTGEAAATSERRKELEVVSVA